MRLTFAKLHSDHDCFLKSHTETGPWVLKMELASSFPVFIPCVAWPLGSVHLTVGFTGKWAALVLSRMGDVSNKFVLSRSRFPTSRPRDSSILISGVQVCLWMVESGLSLQPAELVLQGPGIDEQVQMVWWTQQ